MFNFFLSFRKFLPNSKILNEERFSLSSSSASTSRSSSLKSPSYEQLTDLTVEKTPNVESTPNVKLTPNVETTPNVKLTSNAEKTPNVEKTPTCDDESLMSDDENASKTRHSFEFVTSQNPVFATPNRLQLPNIRRIVGDDDDMSDTDSLAR